MNKSVIVTVKLRLGLTNEWAAILENEDDEQTSKNLREAIRGSLADIFAWDDGGDFFWEFEGIQSEEVVDGWSEEA
jgi:hypothetical protein